MTESISIPRNVITEVGEEVFSRAAGRPSAERSRVAVSSAAAHADDAGRPRKRNHLGSAHS